MGIYSQKQLYNAEVIVLVLAALAVCMIACSFSIDNEVVGVERAQAQQLQETTYTIPDIKTAKSRGPGRSYNIIKSIPTKETKIRWYDSKDGFRFRTLSIRSKKKTERIWAYDVDTDGKKPFDYTIVVGDGGKFFRIPFGIDFRVPKWTKLFYETGRIPRD